MHQASPQLQVVPTDPSKELYTDQEQEPPGCSPHLLRGYEVLQPDSPLPAPRVFTVFTTGKTTARTTPKTRSFRRKFFPGVPDKLWNDWKWQIRNRTYTPGQLSRMLTLAPEEIAVSQAGTTLPLGITPYYMSLLDAENADQPLRRTVVPTAHELTRTPGEADDPLGEESQSPVPGLVHRYPDRVLLLVHDFCSTYCRYCTRSRLVGHAALLPNRSRLEQAIDYIRATPTVRDVLLSGGDPLTLGDDRLDWILTRLRQIPHVEIIRIGTKVPAVLPQRVTLHLVRMLRKHHPLLMSLHFTHPDECTPEAYRACAMLADGGIPLGSQTVLLKGINDSADTMKSLVHHLLRMRVRPYYLYQCDPISGSAHFRTPVAAGLDILKNLRGHTTGYAVPTYVIDAPAGGGKIPLMPDYVLGRDGEDLVLRSYTGSIHRYPDPTTADPGCCG